MAKVKEIQVCGGRITTMLSDACLNYIEDIAQGTDRAKLNFSIVLDDGTTKHITFRQEDDGIHVYGDFEGMPDALEWANRVTDKN
jgi:hypothetical protein